MPTPDRTWRYLELGDYLLIAEAVLGVRAERLGEMPRVVHLASSALAAPAAGFGGVELYREFHVKAAVLGARLAKNHPLPDGNKRSAWVAMVEFMRATAASCSFGRLRERRQPR